ncbi:Crp/Fnr family transcriptional regulator [Marinobacteraceae bacterium S3BR75-40.1]
MTSVAAVLPDFHAAPQHAIMPAHLRDPIDLLREHPLFARLGDDDFRALTAKMRTLDLGAHEFLYQQDMPAQHFYFVISGNLRLFRLDLSGVERTLDSLVPGQCFAEVMIFANPARYACYAEALKASQVLAVPIKAYRALLEAKPDYALQVLTHYAGRAVSRFHDLEIMTVQNARERVVRYLLDLIPDGETENVELELPLPKCLIASRLAMQPETFSRVLNDLKSRGLVTVRRNQVNVIDRELLLDFCQ